MPILSKSQQKTYEARKKRNEKNKKQYGKKYRQLAKLQKLLDANDPELTKLLRRVK
jgi:hypothetical protein